MHKGGILPQNSLCSFRVSFPFMLHYSAPCPSELLSWLSADELLEDCPCQLLFPHFPSFILFKGKILFTMFCTWTPPESIP